MTVAGPKDLEILMVLRWFSLFFGARVLKLRQTALAHGFNYFHGYPKILSWGMAAIWLDMALYGAWSMKPYGARELPPPRRVAGGLRERWGNKGSRARFIVLRSSFTGFRFQALPASNALLATVTKPWNFHCGKKWSLKMEDSITLLEIVAW